MLFDDIVKSMCGLNEDQSPRCGFAINKEIYKIGDTDPIKTLNRIASRPNIRFARIPGFDKTYVKIDIFIDQFSKNDAKMFLSYFDDYGKEVNEVTDESETLPQIFCTFVPLEYKGQYYIIASLPLFWSLCASEINGEVDMLTVLFDAESVVLYETNEIDYDKILAIVEGEVEQEIAYQEELFEKQALEKEIMIDKNDNVSRSHNYVEPSATDVLKSMSEEPQPENEENAEEDF